MQQAPAQRKAEGLDRKSTVSIVHLNDGAQVHWNQKKRESSQHDHILQLLRASVLNRCIVVTTSSSNIHQMRLHGKNIAFTSVFRIEGPMCRWHVLLGNSGRTIQAGVSGEEPDRLRSPSSVKFHPYACVAAVALSTMSSTFIFAAFAAFPVHFVDASTCVESCRTLHVHAVIFLPLSGGMVPDRCHAAHLDSTMQRIRLARRTSRRHVDETVTGKHAMLSLQRTHSFTSLQP